jgi:hypothetical protein
MTTPIPQCPACRMPMQEGFVLDVGHNGRILATRWTEGVPEKGFLQGLKVKGRRQLDTVTFRCPKCGWLIWFAPDAPGGDASTR